MRILVDLQGAQTGSRFRGIGKYALSLVKAMIRRSPDDDFVLLLNGAFPETIEPLRAAFGGLVSQSDIRVWQAPGPIEPVGDLSRDLREIAEIMREHYIRAIEPDVVLVTSLFEGLGDDAVLTINKFVVDAPVACIFYDLTPLILPDREFQLSATHRSWYRARIEDLRRSDLLLGISASSCSEAREELAIPADRVVNIFGAHDNVFEFRNYGPTERAAVGRRMGLNKPFILYNGGLELNKNLRNLVAALALLPPEVRAGYQFACVGKRQDGEEEQILSFAPDPAVRGMLSILGYVSEADLIDLYNACDLFVFPSLREGFGLPPLEAMACGAPTIVSDRTSLPEVVDNPDAVFDPTSVTSIAAKMTQVLQDPAFGTRLREDGLRRAAALSWNACADRALEALRGLAKPVTIDPTHRTAVARTGIHKPNRKTILAQKLDHQGDFLLALPALAKLRARYPDARLDALVGSWNRDAAETSGLFDTVYTLDYFRSKSSVRASIGADEIEALRLRMPYYDYAIDLRRQSETRFILVGINASQYFGYKTGRAELDVLLTNPLDLHPDNSGVRSYFDETHSSEQILRIIDALPFDVNDYVRLPAMGERMGRVPGSIAIFPLAGVDARQWDSARFVALVTHLAADPDISAIAIYAGKREDLAEFRFPDSPKIGYQCGLRFPELSASLSSHETCVGNNSFGVHLASYVGCRTIGIYSGHELPEQWGPAFGDAQVVTVDAPCSPCHLPDRKSCPFDMFCLEDISVQSVLSMIKAGLRDTPVKSYSKIRASNPATAVTPLVHEINRSAFRGAIKQLHEDDKRAVAAAITANFPERTRDRRHIYVDVSAFVPTNDDFAARSEDDVRDARALIERITQAAGAEFEVIEIASGQHDRAFYAIGMNRFALLARANRSEKIVFPRAGDIYIGLDRYRHRNPALWEVLTSWHAAGVRTVFLIDDPTLQSVSDMADPEQAVLTHRFLLQAARFDLIVAASRAGLERFTAWAMLHTPQRARPLSVGVMPRSAPDVDTASLLALIVDDVASTSLSRGTDVAVHRG